MSGEPRLVTFGCRLNTYESEVMRDHARAAGLDDAVIINTCAVTAEAERQARQTIRRLRRENPQARIVVTGCAAQVNPDAWAAMPEVDRVLGNAEKLKAEHWRFEADAPAVAVGDIMATAPDALQETAHHLIGGMEGRTRAFVQVQQGCDHRCTFCIIPLARGPSQSLPVGPVVEQTRALVANGYREVVLTGVDLTAWGADLPGKPTLGQLVRRLLKLVPDLPRLRLSSLDPVEIDPDLLDCFVGEPRVMPHVHLSVQAGDDMILKRMKRRHSRADVLRVVETIRARRPDAVFGADLIAGFPTEDEAMAENSRRLIEEAGFTHLHVFPYSARPGTPAARIPGLPGPVVKARAAALRDTGARVRAAWLQSRLGTLAEVLFETETTGNSAHFIPVRVAERVDSAPGAGIVRAGSIRVVRLTARDGEGFIGTEIEEEQAA